MARDWSSFGAKERNKCYSPILTKLQELYPNKQDRPNIRILNPGCGLGRLPWEIAKLGFCSQGNEFSYFMLLASHFVLNKCYKQQMFTIYPYCDMTNNQWTFHHNTDHHQGQLAYCKIPDVSPMELLEHTKGLGRNDLLSMYRDDYRALLEQSNDRIKRQEHTLIIIQMCPSHLIIN